MSNQNETTLAAEVAEITRARDEQISLREENESLRAEVERLKEQNDSLEEALWGKTADQCIAMGLDFGKGTGLDIYQSALAKSRTEVEPLQAIARLVASILFHGDFVAETANERELELQLRNAGYWADSEDQLMRILDNEARDE